MVAALGFAAVCSLVVGPPAHGATALEVLQLRLQPCPAYRVAQSRDHSPGEIQAAKDGTFAMTYAGPAVLIVPVDWDMDPYENRNWVHFLHGFRWLDQLLYAYVHDGDLDALAQARDLALDWIAANPLPAGDPGQAWGGKTVGDRAGYLAFVTRAAACRGLLSDPQASTLIDSLRTHGVALTDPDRYHPTNHGMFDDLGLALAGEYLGFLPEGGGWVARARERFSETLESRLDPDQGVWLEHSSAYQFVLIRLVERFAGMFGTAPLAADLARMREAAGWFVMPDGRMAPVGDSGSGRPEPWAIEEGADDAGLRLMKHAGLAMVKHGNGYLIVTAGFHNHTHKHEDDLGFHLYDRGRDVISDSGNYTYNHDKWRSFAISHRAHSVLSVSDQRFQIWKKDAVYGSGLRAGGKGAGWYAIEGRNPMLRRVGVKHRRVFLYRPGRALLVVDIVRSRRGQTYDRGFQLAPELRSSRRGKRLGLRAESFQGALIAADKRTRRSLVEGRRTPPEGWSFPRGGTRIARTTANYRTRGANVNLVAAIGLDGAVRARVLRVTRRSLAVAVRGIGRRSVLRVSRRGSRLFVRRG